MSNLGLPTRLSEVGVGDDDYDLIADDAMRDFVVASAPVEVSKDDIKKLQDWVTRKWEADEKYAQCRQ